MTRCCVPKCSEIAVHKFPKDPKMRKLWLKAIRRKEIVIKETSRLCRNHFTENDYEGVSKYTGLAHQHKYLKKTAVPSVFSWTENPLTLQSEAIQKRYETREIRMTCAMQYFKEQATNTPSAWIYNVIKL